MPDSTGRTSFATPRLWVSLLAFLLVVGAALSGAARADAAASLKRVVYRGYVLEVPRSWSVFSLSSQPHTCVRFDRHAVYLGRPGADQRCPAQPAGRTEAILVSPVAGAGSQPALPAGSAAGDGRAAGSVVRVVERAHGIVVTATWGRDPQAIRRALRVSDLMSLARRSQTTPAASPLAILKRAAVRERAAARARSAQATEPATPGEVYTGPGFDACSTPSTTTMSDWLASPYRAIGIYIGGANMACSQPNLNATWVSQESAAGWHLAPIYVGLQAPTNSCGCAAITPAQASAQGAAAASDAVAQAQAVGIGSGNPIFFDMEGYNRTTANTQAVLGFLQAWTQGLHGSGYLSGVYSSTNSGITDLVSQAGTGYVEPDEIWFAAWNGSQTTTDPSIPSTEWADHQRLHQYEGGHNEKWGGATINIDGDYLDAATAAAGSSGPPTASTSPGVSGAPLVGQTLSESHARWSAGLGGVSSYSYQWEDCTPDGATCVPIAGATAPTYTVASGDVGQSLRVLESATGAGGTSAPAASGLTGAVQAQPTSGYWLATAYGNVFNSPGAPFFGSPARWMRTAQIVGMAATADDRGYWLAEATGKVLAYGDAARIKPIVPAAPVIGIAGDPSSHGFWLFTARGNVVALAGARFRGSPSHSRVRLSNFSAMSATLDGRGYWLTTSTGRVYAFGDAKRIYGIHPAHPVRSIEAAPGGGAWLSTAYGNIYGLGGAPFYGSAAHWHVSNVAGLAPTADRLGYWLVASSGTTYPFGDAASWKLRRPPHPVTGIVGG